MNASILSMNQTVGTRELESLPMRENTEPVYYWHVYRRSANGRRWVLICDYSVTETVMAELFGKYFRTHGFALRCLLRY